MDQQKSHFDSHDPAEPLEVGKARRVPEPRLKVSSGTETPRARAAKADFCRQARRVRAAYANEPVQMYERLKLLTAAPEAKETIPEPEPPAFQQDSEDVFAPYTLLDAADPPMDDEDESDDLPGERVFRQLVAGRLVGRGAVILRYSERLELLKEAKRLGLDRFNANLIIAAVENEAREIEPTLAAPAKKSRIRGWFWMIAAVQSFIVAGFWRLVRG